jgi:hypothetical protein
MKLTERFLWAFEYVAHRAPAMMSHMNDDGLRRVASRFARMSNAFRLIADAATDELVDRRVVIDDDNERGGRPLQ